MLCTKCKKRRAVIMIKKIEGTKQIDEGYCISCAKDLGIAPIDDMMKKLGVTPEMLEDMEDQLEDMIESGDIPEDFENMNPFSMFPFPMEDNSDAEDFSDAPKKKKEKKQKKSQLDTYGTNLNNKAKDGQIDRIIGRDKELLRVIQILNRRAKNNPALIGEPGVGKTAIAEALALKIVEKQVPSKLLDKEIYLMDFTALVAGTQFRGQFEQRVKAIIDEAKARGNVILVIDEVHTIVSAGGTEGSLTAANILKPALARGDIQIIGATTLSEYRKHIEKDSALERRFQPVMVEEPSIEETIDIIRGIKDYYEEHHHITLTDEVIKQAVVLSKRFIYGRFLPDKAIDVIDEAGSAANLDNELLTELTILKKELKKVEKELSALDEKSEDFFEKNATLKSKEISYKNQIEALEPQCESTVLSTDDIAKVIEMWANVPVKKLTMKDSDKLSALNESLKKKIIGQDKAADSVSKAIIRKRAGIEKRLRPASFIFVGPTGVGKTEFAKVLTEELFGSSDDLIRLDMTEFQEQHSISKLIGSPPGYVGYDEAGQLTEKIRRKPYSVVLFDEIEKAHPNVYNILLQILDEGRLTDSQGRVVSFENTVIILTSNAGIGFGTDPLGFNKTAENMEVLANDKLKKIFKPEILNRIDEIITFNKLEVEDFEKIAKLNINEMEEALLEKGISLYVDDKAVKLLAEKGYSEKYGARELRRTVQKLVGDPIAEKIVYMALPFGSSVSVTVADGEIKVD